MLRNLGVALLLLGFCERMWAEVLRYTIAKQEYLFSKAFNMHSEKGPIGLLTETKLSLRTHYDLYNAKGIYEARGICRILSLGSLYAWAKELDIYDAVGNKIGMVDGQAFSTAKAKYSLYDAMDYLLGIAYLDKDSSGFSIMHPLDDKVVLAFLKRNFVENALDDWEVALYDDKAIDPRILKIFSAFTLDFQGDFKEDT
ncbi:MAG: hypothetical protein FJZ63_04500 [Chlamydiae bacterium]|nr:hypothetical protein [Chlamydiota bacterium]